MCKPKSKFYKFHTENNEKYRKEGFVSVLVKFLDKIVSPYAKKASALTFVPYRLNFFHFVYKFCSRHPFA